MLGSKDHSIYFPVTVWWKLTPETPIDLWYTDDSWVHSPAKHFSSSRDQDFRGSSADVTQNIKKVCAPRLRFMKSEDYFWFIKSILKRK